MTRISLYAESKGTVDKVYLKTDNFKTKIRVLDFRSIKTYFRKFLRNYLMRLMLTKVGASASVKSWSSARKRESGSAMEKSWHL